MGWWFGSFNVCVCRLVVLLFGCLWVCLLLRVRFVGLIVQELVCLGGICGV